MFFCLSENIYLNYVNNKFTQKRFDYRSIWLNENIVKRLCRLVYLDGNVFPKMAKIEKTQK